MRAKGPSRQGYSKILLNRVGREMATLESRFENATHLVHVSRVKESSEAAPR